MTINLDRDLQQALYREKAQELYELWLETPKAKQVFVGVRNNFTRDKYKTFIDNFISDQYDGVYSVYALDEAADAILAERRAEAEKVAAQIALADQIEAYMTENKIAQDDLALTIIDELQKDPAFSFEKFVTFVQLHPERFNHLMGFKAFSMLDAVRRATKDDLVRLRQRYGSKVDEALEMLAKRIHKGTEKLEDQRAAEGVSNRRSMYSHEDEAADRAKREAEQKLSPLYKIQQAGLKRECENITTSFIVAIDGQRIDHGATQDARKELRQIYDAGVAQNTPWNVLRDQLRAEANRLAGIR